MNTATVATGVPARAWLASGPNRLRALMAKAAPGVAGASRDWLAPWSPVPMELASQAPELWRIGTAVTGPAGHTVTFPAGMPLLDESHLQVTSTLDTRAPAEHLIETLLLRVMHAFRPGQVRLHVWDTGRHSGSLPGLYPLTRTGLLTTYAPDDLGRLLDALSTQIVRVHTRSLGNGHASLKALADDTGRRDEPWVVVALLGNGDKLPENDRRQLARVLSGGLACGISAVLLDVEAEVNAPTETLTLDQSSDGRVVATSSMTGPFVTIHPDPAASQEAATRASHGIADVHERLRGQLSRFVDLLPSAEQWCTQDSRTGLVAPIGFVEGVPQDIALNDASPHALIAGPSGSGKTNLILAMIASLTTRYSPDELELYLLDFKEGVSFAQFAPGPRDPSWLPHARLLGVNMNDDREFGLALLRYLKNEMKRRAKAAKRHEVSKLEELRDRDLQGRWPRIVAVIDEFQVLFSDRDTTTKEAAKLLEDIARRGRSQGIHLVLASQDVSSIDAFWGRPALWEQFVLRIALPRAKKVLAQLNDVADTLPKWHVVINHESGVRHANVELRIPDASTGGAVTQVQQALHASFRRDRPEPQLFDGAIAPTTGELMNRVLTGPVPHAVVGQRMDVDGSAATVPLAAGPGRNIAVIGSGATDAMAVLGAVVESLAGQHEDGEAQFFFAQLTPDAAHSAGRLVGGENVSLRDYRTVIEHLAKDVTERLSDGVRDPLYLVIYGADAADSILDKAGTEALRKVLHQGPEVGVHVIGWWRSATRLKTLLSSPASLDDLGVVVGCDVQGNDLGSLLRDPLLSWSPRPGRALLFDRAHHTSPEVIIVPAGEEES